MSVVHAERNWQKATQNNTLKRRLNSRRFSQYSAPTLILQIYAFLSGLYAAFDV